MLLKSDESVPIGRGWLAAGRSLTVATLMGVTGPRSPLGLESAVTEVEKAELWEPEKLVEGHAMVLFFAIQLETASPTLAVAVALALTVPRPDSRVEQE
eukprot:g44773.t1